MEKDTAVAETLVDVVEEQEIVEIPVNALDRVGGGLISCIL